MTNRLVTSTSPYLLQHAENPVDWWPWCDAAFAEARRRAAPVLLSVGYASCHWCHVMAHESFEDPAVAEFMNRHFVNIKVDREERPDVDAVYMRATQAMTGQGGWPMTCLLTPDGEPFHCGTYYPSIPRPGMPSFRQLLGAVVEAWSERGDEVRRIAAQVAQEVGRHAVPSQSVIGTAALDQAMSRLVREYDPEHGGFGHAPKFPPSMVLEFMLRHHERTGSAEALSIVDHTMEAMARGGMYDQLAGGFARYSTDAGWVVPHFEKMLYDNALLLRVYAHLARRSSSTLASRVALETGNFILDTFGMQEGAFAAALDADTNGVEGLTYVWTPAELVEALGEADGSWAAALFGVTEQGTFERGSSVLRLPTDPEDKQRYQDVRQRLLVTRAQRPAPARDDKVITEWNGLAITALAEAGMALGQSHWIEAAAACADFLLRVHLVDGRLRRTSRHGVVGSAAGVLSDYACFAVGLLALHQATGRPRWLDAATDLQGTALERFAGAEPGMYYDTADDAERLVHRPSDPTDNATPSGASALAEGLLTASVLGGTERATAYRVAAEQALGRAGALLRQVPRFAGNWLSVAEAALAGPLQVAVVGEADERTELLVMAARLAHGGAVVVGGEPDTAGVPLLAGRPLVSGAGVAAYVCRGYVCERPVTTPADLATALGQ